MKKLFLITLSLVVFLGLESKSQKTANNHEDSIGVIIEKKMKESGIVGLGAAIIVDKKLVWKNGYGYTDREAKTPFTAETIMNIASIAKTFTGVCIMKAIEEGKVSLDEDINKYLPFKVINPNFPNEKITLRHLATHTSSLTDRYPFYDSTYVAIDKTPEKLGDFLKNYFAEGGKYYSKDNFLNKKPGNFRDYSNFGAGLAGYIVELQTGKKLNEYGKQHIFKPLKMANTDWAKINLKKHTKLYKKQGDSVNPIPLYQNITYPDGGIRTNVDELSRLFIALLNDGNYNGRQILKAETVKEMTRFHHSTANKPENVNVEKLNQGIFWATKLGGTRMGHNGTDPGVRTFMLSDLKKEIGVVIFFNTSLNDNEEGVYFDIYNELYQYGVKLKKK